MTRPDGVVKGSRRFVSFAAAPDNWSQSLGGTEYAVANHQVVFLFDVDNTLLDNDRVVADLMHHLERQIGAERQQRYWAIFEQLRSELGYADYLGALQRYRIEHPRDSHILAVSHYLLNYPFATRLFPNALDAVEHCRKHGPAVIVSDGDVVFQPLKVDRSGLAEALDDNVLIYIHKEFELDDIAARYPADHYVMIDDKVRILAAMKQAWGPRVTTIFPRQGHYALDPKEVAKYPVPDLTIESIGALRDVDLASVVAT
jgi:FMN phosphatase YigB (HAD superfamily)